jgi:hypothetical protein
LSNGLVVPARQEDRGKIALPGIDILQGVTKRMILLHLCTGRFGVFSDALFSALILMAIVTTLTTPPLLKIYPTRITDRPEEPLAAP